MKYFAILAFALGLVLTPVDATRSSYASAQPAISKPLMIIRFNQRQVLYQKSLYRAVSEAIRIAPAVQFDIVSYMPTRGRSAQQLGQVVATMQKMGISTQQFSARTQPSDQAGFEEVHIFVR